MNRLSGSPRPVVHRAIALEQNLGPGRGNISADQPVLRRGLLLEGQSGDPLKRHWRAGRLGIGGAVDPHPGFAFGDDVQVFGKRVDQQGLGIAPAVRVAEGQRLNSRQVVDGGRSGLDLGFGQAVDVFQIPARPVITDIADVQIGLAVLRTRPDSDIFPVVVGDAVQHIGAEMAAPGADGEHLVRLPGVIMHPQHVRVFAAGDNARGFADGRVFDHASVHPVAEPRGVAGRPSSPRGEDEKQYPGCAHGQHPSFIATVSESGYCGRLLEPFTMRCRPSTSGAKAQGDLWRRGGATA